MKPLPRADYRRTRSSLLISTGIRGTQQTATLVSTHLREERVGLPGRPTLAHRAVLRLDRLSALSTRDDNDNHQLTPSAEAPSPDVLLNAVHRIASRHPP
jgi:hypothetical protein